MEVRRRLSLFAACLLVSIPRLAAGEHPPELRFDLGALDHAGEPGRPLSLPCNSGRSASSPFRVW